MLLRHLIVLFALLAFATRTWAMLPSSSTKFVASPSFDKDHDAAVAANLPGVTFVLRTADGRTQFQCGERIRVQYVLSSSLKKTYQCDPCMTDRGSVFNHDQFVCEASEGAVDPWAEDYLSYYYEIAGDSVTSTNYLSGPVVDTVDLNDWVAFDRPGVYRIYAVTYRVYAVTIDRNGIPTPPEGETPSTSTVLTLTITPANKAWQDGVIAGATAPAPGTWDERMEGRVELLTYLRTKEADEALLHFMVTARPYQYASDKDWYDSRCAEGILQSPCREEMLPCVGRDIVEPDVPITDKLLALYTFLLLYQASPTPSSAKGTLTYDDAKLSALSLLRMALPAKRGVARIMSEEAAKKFDDEDFLLGV